MELDCLWEVHEKRLNMMPSLFIYAVHVSHPQVMLKNLNESLNFEFSCTLLGLRPCLHLIAGLARC
jgi:hypothetical protein